MLKKTKKNLEDKTAETDSRLGKWKAFAPQKSSKLQLLSLSW